MTLKNRWWRSAAVTALTLGFVVAPSSVGTATPAEIKAACSYGDIPDAPAGAIPRDDRIHASRDPLAAWAAKNKAKAKAARTSAATVTVPVAFHVLRKDSTLAGGNVSDEQIGDQIDVLNAAFANSGFQFELASVDRTTSSSWFKMAPTAGSGEPRFYRGSSKEIKTKQALHEGDAQTLNLYTGDLGRSLLGWAYLPWDFTEGGLPRFYDGVVVDYRSLPGGSIPAYNLGDTGTHEVGHWLGLLHTFDGGCGPDGDFVSDTAPEASPAFGCPSGRDTCTGDTLQDPIHNFMDYTVDECMHEFTAGQTDRMQMTWAKDRVAG